MSNKKNKDTNKTYYVRGMHCAACELLIEKELVKISGVDKANVSLKKQCVEVTASTHAFPSVEHLNTLFADSGYVFSEEKPLESKLTRTDIYKVSGVFVLFVILFVLFERTGVFMRFTVSGSSSPFAYFLFGIVAGLSSCAALVGGLLLSLSSKWNELYNGNAKLSYKPFIYFNASRIAAFALMGGLLGLAGSYIGFSIQFSILLTLVVSVLMLVLGFQMLNVKLFKGIKLAMPKSVSKHISDETKFEGKYMPLFVGAMTFFLPCGFTLIAQTNAVTSGSFVQGALMLTAFALGTLPILLLLSFSSVKFYANPAVAKKFSLFAGMLIIFFALYTINSTLNVLGWASLNDLSGVLARNNSQPPEEVQITNNVQFMQMEASGFEYYPRSFKLKAGVPTKWEIYNSGASGCAQAVYARGLYPDVIYLQPGLNTVEFTPETPGTYKISCSMGMVAPVIVTVY